MRLLSLLACFLLPLSLLAQQGTLLDKGGFLEPAQQTKLQKQLDAAAAKGLAVTVLTVPDQEGRSVREFALQKAHELKLEEAGPRPAALLILSRKEKKLDLLVSPAWEWTLPDTLTAYIKREMINQFKYGDFYAGLSIGIERLEEKLDDFRSKPDYDSYAALTSDLLTAKGKLALLEVTLVTKEYKEEKLSEEQFQNNYFVYAKAPDGNLVKVRFSRTAIPLIRSMTTKGSARIIVRIAETNPLDVQLMAVLD